jgi:hypothetical protein
MRVTVQIEESDGDKGTVQQSPSADAGSSGAAPAGGGQEPSPELAARAARIGALSAGPAPSGPPAGSGSPGFAPAGLGAAQPAAPADGDATTQDQSAGPAPDRAGQ